MPLRGLERPYVPSLSMSSLISLFFQVSSATSSVRDGARNVAHDVSDSVRSHPQDQRSFLPSQASRAASSVNKGAEDIGKSAQETVSTGYRIFSISDHLGSTSVRMDIETGRISKGGSQGSRQCYLGTISFFKRTSCLEHMYLNIVVR